MKILLVEDEQKLADVVKRGLELQGYTVDIVSDGKKAMTRISLHRNDYDVIILDLMLPSMDGEAICKQMRVDNITIPVIILTARAETETKVKLLMSGADDYLVKPFLSQSSMHASMRSCVGLVMRYRRSSNMAT